MKKKEILDVIEKEIIEDKEKNDNVVVSSEEETVPKTEQVIEEQSPPPKEEEEVFKIEDMDGIGSLTIEKLKKMGIYNIADLAIASAVEIHEKLASQKHTQEFCQHIVQEAHRHVMKSSFMKNPIITSDKLLEDELKRKRFSVGDELIDEWLGGGFESNAVTELYGRFKCGKTQMCDSAAVQTAASGRNVLFIDTENTYSPTRIKEIAMKKKLDVDKVLKNIKAMKPLTASVLFLYIQELSRHIRENDIKLVIVDSIIALHRAEYLGRSNLSSRQQELAKIMSTLVRCAENFNIGVIITNQVLESPDPFKKGLFATGGNIISHASTHRIMLQAKPPPKGKSNRALSKMIMEDSPRYARTEQIIELVGSGVKGVDPSKGLSKEEAEAIEKEEDD